MTQDDEVSDILGFVPARQRRRDRRDSGQTLAQHAALRRQDHAEDVATAVPTNIQTLNVADAMHGVSVGWLSTIFAMDPMTVKKKLRDCPPIHRRKAGFTYDLKQAAAYLIPPVFDVDQYLRTMKPSDLPTQLQDAYWSAMRKRQQWEADAGHLWRTDQVLEVLGEVFKHIKFAIQLWPDEVDRQHGLTPEQRAMMVGMGDALQNEIHRRLLTMPTTKKTPSTIVEGVSEPVAPAGNDDDYTRLI